MFARERMLTATAVIFLVILAIGGAVMFTSRSQLASPAPPAASSPSIGPEIELPPPQLTGTFSVEQALYERRSHRAYGDAPLTLTELSQLLWAAQGVTHPEGWRTAASAGGMYPLELLAAVGNVLHLEPGVYRYYPDRHTISLLVPGDRRAELSAAAVNQQAVAQGAAVLVLAGVYERTAVRYGERAERYVHMEVGIASQNLHLQATALGLGTVFIGAFDSEQTSLILGLAEDERPLALMPVGRLGGR
jgi:SagB-type dehydrogenase family enzyme